MNQITLSGPDFEDVDYGEIKRFLEEFGFKVQKEEDFLLKADINSVAERMARIRVLNPDKEELNENPFPIEIEYEEKNLKRSKRKKGVIYSGNHFIKILQNLLIERLDIQREWIIYFSDQLFATFEGRWHIRVIIFGIPVVISVPGVVYGPARSREYYLSASLSVPMEEKEHLKENDPRKTEVLKGYLLQALYFYHSLVKNKKFEFCDDKSCSLYNSHWQREVLTAQFHHRLCEKHLKEFII